MRAFKTYKTISGREIKVNSNESSRHYTIKTSGGVFRTYKLSQEEFDSMYYYTGNDWQQFLNSNDYYKVR